MKDEGERVFCSFDRYHETDDCCLQVRLGALKTMFLQFPLRSQEDKLPLLFTLFSMYLEFNPQASSAIHHLI